MAVYAIIYFSTFVNNSISGILNMATGKKYNYRIAKNRKNWKAEITRQVTSRKTVVSKRQTGFETEQEAQEWAENELKLFIENHQERNKRHAKQRELRDEKAEQAAQEAREARAAHEQQKAQQKRDEEDF